MMENSNPLSKLIRAVSAKPKYATVCPGLIKRIGEQELAKRNTLKEAIKSTCGKLYQVGGAYLTEKIDFSSWLTELDSLPRKLHSPEIIAYCLDKMNAHASTRERLPILNVFYQQTLKSLLPLRSIIDLGCGLNPLALPWMPLNNKTIYCGIDLFNDLTSFDNEFLRHLKIKGRVECGDILSPMPSDQYQLALALKLLPLIEQIEKHSTIGWLEKIPADFILVSYPVLSLGGKGKGMEKNYIDQFMQIIQECHWVFERYDFSCEIAFLIHKQITHHG
jgi:16S rRNA (guanine(1405)-N(7))-methyltransferase